MKIHIPKGRKIKYSSYVTKSGKLQPHLRPAIFCDTSFLLDYWNSSIHKTDFVSLPFNKIDSTDALFLKYLRSDVRTKRIYTIRKRVEDFHDIKTLIFTPACRLELEEVMTALRFKKYGVEVTENSLITRKSSKEIGDILIKVRKDFENQRRENGLERIDENLEMIFFHFFYATNRIDEGLEGMLEADIVNFNLGKKDLRKLIYIANLQVGFADIFHLISASRLGCEYFFTLDNDFLRIADLAKSEFGVEIITDPNRMLRIL